MRVAGIEIRNILGIQELDVKPGSITVVSGKNAVGKTSVLEAIKAGLGGGHDATLVRKGADEGEVVFVLDNGARITKQISPAGSRVKVDHPEENIKGAQTWINGLLGGLSLNPVEFLNASKKRQVDLLLEAIPMEVTAEQLAEALSVDPSEIETEGHALEVIERYRKQAYDERTGVNRSLKDKKSTVSQLMDSLPDEVHDAEELDQTIKALEEARKQAQDGKERFLEAVRQRWEQEREKAKAAADQHLEALRIEYEKACEEVRSKLDQKLQAVDARKEELKREAEEKYDPSINEAVEVLAKYREKKESLSKIEVTKQIIDRHEREIERLESRSSQLTESLNRLEDLKKHLVSELPIKGLEVIDGEIFVGGIPFTRVNDAKKVEIAMTLAVMQARKVGAELPLIVVDGLESLDDDAFKALKEWAKKSEFQLVVSRRTSGDLTVETEGK